MDTEEGVEVVWNEVLFSERKISDIQHVRWNWIMFKKKLFGIFRIKLAKFSIN
jgi:hypothetical protein